MLQPPTPPPMTTARASVRIELLPDQWYRPVEGIYDTGCSWEALCRHRAGDHDARHARCASRRKTGLGVLEHQRRLRGQGTPGVCGQAVECEQVALRIRLALRHILQADEHRKQLLETGRLEHRIDLRTGGARCDGNGDTGGDLSDRLGR